MKFRADPLYQGEFYLALTIPATEQRDIIPCDAVYHPDCPACLRGRLHTPNQHDDNLRRVYEASRA